MRLTLTKLTTALLILAASSGVYAQNYKGVYKGEVVAKPAPCIIPCMLKDGFYIGAQVGYDAYRVRATSSFSGFSANPALSATGWVGGLLAGYGQYLNDVFYLGAEVMANYSDAESSSHATIGTLATSESTFRVRGSWGLAVLPGVRLNDGALGYVRLGWNWANMKANASGTIGPVGASTSKSNTSNGFSFGFGLETLMYENWSVRGEYTHTNYNSFSANVAGASTRFNPSDNQVMVAAIYHFAC